MRDSVSGLLRQMRFMLCLSVMGFATAHAGAHPMGNFSVSHYSRIDLQSGKIVVHYFIDLAEIPTYQELQQANIEVTADQKIDPSSPVIVRLVERRGEELGRGLALHIDGQSQELHMVSSGVIFPPGAGGLPTMKMGFVYEATYPATIHRAQVGLEYADHNYQGQSGWKEIVAICSGGQLIDSSVSSTDRSNELSNYPTDLLKSAPQTLEVSLRAAILAPMAATTETRVVAAKSATLVAGVPAASLGSAAPFDLSIKHAHPRVSTAENASQGGDSAAGNTAQRVVKPGTSVAMPMTANRRQTPRSTFTQLISEQRLSLWFLFTAAVIAIGLGAMHALEPGHGKTIVAAYLVGSRGTARHAVLLGLIVTVSHTAGVFALGAITLYASRYIVPEQLYPWLGVFSGITISGLGCYMFLRRWTGTATDHSHAPGSSQAHWPFGRRSNLAEEDPDQAKPGQETNKSVSLTQLFTLGITGGIIPCPAALIVLLSAFALHRVALGFFLIVAFSLGLAGVLIGFGLAMVYSRRFMSHFKTDGSVTTRWLPMASSAFITVLGLGLALQALATTHLSLPVLSQQRLGPLLFVAGLGLILGMRHSTDADHVVAISTIVSKQRSIRNAAVIGTVWGLGHTITILAVGSLIILFGVEIPPRVGLSMEFCVALMLILLGILNLSGLMQRITTYFTPSKDSRRVSEHEGASERTLRAKFDASIAKFGWYQCIRPLIIGLVHGLAGSAAVALLVLSTIHNPYWATAYLLIFGIGTMLGMMGMTAAMAVPLTYAGDRFSNLSRYFGVASGVVSLCFGSFLVYQLGFLGGLFTRHPQWTPQ